MQIPTRRRASVRTPGVIAAALLAAMTLQPPRLAADGRHRQLIREIGQIAVQMAAASKPDRALGERYRKAASAHDNLPFDHATSRCAEIANRAFAHGASAAGLRAMKHRGAETVERETQEMVAEANRCLGDEFNTSGGEEEQPPSRPPGRDGFETAGSPDRPPQAPQRPQQTPRPQPVPEPEPHRPTPAQQPPRQTPRRPQPEPQPEPQRPTPAQPPPQQQTRRQPPLTSQVERIERICDLQRLAQWIFRRYRTGRPIARVRVVNAAQPTYLLFFSGMEIDRIGQATTPLQALIAWGNFQGFDAYRIGILNAVADLPRGTNVILAGHSQGGMEAQQIVPHLIARYGLRVPQVISYGAPITVGRTPGTSYQHVRALDDWVIGLDRQYNLSATEIIHANRRSQDPHTCYPDPAAGLSLYRVPSVSTLKTPCYEIDVTTIEEFQARNLFDLYLGATNQRTSSNPPLNPTRNVLPDHLRVNCFWVALAQDRLWATGLPIPARCETRPIPREEIPHVLARWHGHKRIDDRHGTREEAYERHWKGEPVGTTKEQIEKTLNARGSRAIIFSGDRRNPGAGHVFNARRGDNGEMEYFDGQDNQDASWRFTTDYEFWMYQTQQ